MNIYEIYTKHPTTGETWELIWVVAPSAKSLETMPLFDEVVLKQAALLGTEDLSGLVIWDGKEFLGMSPEFYNLLRMSNKNYDSTLEKLKGE